MIQFEKVNKTFKVKNGTVEACRNIDMKIEKGDIFGIVGYSGAGKSTLLRMVNGLERPTSGKILVNGIAVNELTKRELRKSCQQTSMIFQQFNLVMSKTVYENVAMPLKLRHFPKHEIDKRVEEMLEFVGLSVRSNAYPGNLSGGQRQRVGIARALITKPEILLCDEATSALDPQTTEAILNLLRKVNSELGVTIVLITHQINVVQKICNKMAVMENGVVVEQGDVKNMFLSPETSLTRSFVDTVIEQSIPSAVYKNAVSSDENFRIWKIRYLDTGAGEEYLRKLENEFMIRCKILFMSVNELQENVLSVIGMQCFGTDEKLSNARAYLKKRYVFEEDGTFESSCL